MFLDPVVSTIEKTPIDCWSAHLKHYEAACVRKGEDTQTPFEIPLL